MTKEQSPQDDLLRSIFGPPKKSWQKDMEKEGYELTRFEVITEKQRQEVDYSHKVVMSERDFANLFRYIKSLKKQIAKLKKVLEKHG